jgi:hypothetical protein
MKKTFLILTLLAIVSSGYAQLEYKDVAGIFYNRCSSCHHAGGGAPFSLTNYSSAYDQAANIDYALSINHMPPWPADTNYRRFSHEHIITASEKAAIQSWISTGALAGDTTLAPPAPVYSQYRLTPPPDLILRIPTFTSNATATQDAYDLFVIPSTLTTTRKIRAVEIVPGNPEIVHHASVGADTNAASTSNLSGNAFTFPANVGIGGFTPGAEPIVFPNSSILKMGVTIKAGSQILIQIHYPAGTGGMVDSTQIRLYFYPTGTTGVREVYAFAPIQNWSYTLPPNQVTTVTADTNLLDWFPISVFSTLPHSHKVCKDILDYVYKDTSITAGAPDTIPMMHIPDWQFHWQFYYYYRHMVKIPPGYRYHGEHIYDNTASNPNNPFSPPQLIYPGVNSNDEMMYDSYQILVYYPGDENINIDSLLRVDPLLTASVAEMVSSPKWTYTFAYPNPFSETATIQVVSNEQRSGNYSLELYDVSGRKIKVDAEKKENSFEISRTGLPAGVYFYRVLSGDDTIGEGKVVVE